jgi:hypothetical protein
VPPPPAHHSTHKHRELQKKELTLFNQSKLGATNHDLRQFFLSYHPPSPPPPLQRKRNNVRQREGGEGGLVDLFVYFAVEDGPKNKFRKSQIRKFADSKKFYICGPSASVAICGFAICGTNNFLRFVDLRTYNFRK